jgi:hypothetical protein
MLVAGSTSLFSLRSDARRGDREGCAELASNLHALHANGAADPGGENTLPGLKCHKLSQHEITGKITRAGEKGRSVIVVDMCRNLHEPGRGSCDNVPPCAIRNDTEAGTSDEHAITGAKVRTL